MSFSRVGWGPRLVAAVLVLIGVLAAVGVVVTAQEHESLEAEARTRAAAATAASLVAAELRTTVTESERRALDGFGGAPPLRLSEAEQRGVPTTTTIRARDTGEPLLDESGVVVVATYDSPTRPASVAERRASFAGLHVVPMQIEDALSRIRPAEGGIAVSGPEQVVAEVAESRPAEATTHTVVLSPALAADWTVTVWTPETGVPGAAWAAAVLIGLLGLAGAAALLHREQRSALAAEELRRLRAQSAGVARMAAVAQQSLDLAEVLPAISTELTSALQLRGLALTTTGPEGELPFFSVGEEPGTPVSSHLPARVEPGETVSVLLARAGRTVARLQVVAGRRLDAHDVDTLASVAEILASALANAEAFAQQRELLQRLRSVDELKTVFLATASHELRTPVGAITGFARLLSSKVDVLTPDQVRSFADRVDNNAQQLASLVDNLLDFSRLERGAGAATEHEVLDLGATVRRILDQQPDVAADHVVTCQTDPGVHVLGSDHAVERVLTNLVGNAAKYSPVGTTIRVGVRAGDGRAELVVDDEGAGVPEGDREQIFSRFFRGRGDAVVNTRGAGLGLAIVSEFAASMAGQVSVATAPSGGARFVVSYPCAGQPIRGESDAAS